MSFTSAAFILFFLAVLALRRAFPAARTQVLLLASLVFLGTAGWGSLFACVGMSVVNWLAALRCGGVAGRGVYLLMQALNLACIPLAASLNGRSLSYEEGGDAAHGLVLLAGLSFFTLQHMAYLADVHSGRLLPETRITRFMLFSAYFPKLLCGPIVPYSDFTQQLSMQEPFPPRQDLSGFKRALTGYVKKMVIADALAPSVSSVFDYHDLLPGVTILAAAALFTLQLYFDFSGYTDIAIGCSRLLGITLPENFALPLRATGMREFWRRWHITLLTFFTTYVFMPLSYRLRRHGAWSVALPMLLVFVLSALWHGLALTFLLWGLTHAAYLMAEHFMKIRMTLPRATRRIAGLIKVWLLFSLSNIFFRAENLATARHLLERVFSRDFMADDWAADFLAPLAVGGHQADLFNFFQVLQCAFLFLAFERKIISFADRPSLEPARVLLLLTLLFVFGVFASSHRFIYMQF